MSIRFDILDDILDTINLNGTVYFQHDFMGDWGIETTTTPYQKFHIIVDGQCWVRATFLEEPICLGGGDIIAFPYGAPYRLSAARDTQCVAVEALFEANQEEQPFFSEGEVSATVVFGHVKFTRDFNHPFIQHLPQMICVRAEELEQLDWFQAVARMIIAETRTPQPGSASVVKRLAEVLHLYTLRSAILARHDRGSYLAVFNNPSIYKALHLIHTELAKRWTLESLAQQIGLSRTTFAMYFQDLVGMPPMRYITMWRMQKAKGMLETTDLTMFEIAQRVGYGSEAAFSRAFQREFEQTPGAARHVRRTLAR